MEDEIIFSEVIEELGLIWEETDITNLDLRDTEDKLSYKDQTENYKKAWNMAKYRTQILRQGLETLNEAKQNLANAESQLEFMEEERIDLMTTIENKNKHILEIEKKAAKSAEDAKAALALYTKANNQIKDVMYQASEKRVTMQMEKDDLQEQLQQLRKIMDAQAQDQKNMIDYLNKKMAEVETEKNRNAKAVEIFYDSMNECKKHLNDTMMQSEKEKILSQRAIIKLQNNLRNISEELTESKKSVTNSEAEKIVSKTTIGKLQNYLRNLSVELKESEKSVTYSKADKNILHRTITTLQDNKWNLVEQLEEPQKRFLNETDKVQVAEQRTKELAKIIDDQKLDKETALAKLDKLDKDKTDLENQLRLKEKEVELLYNSIETERNQHESAMKE
ncbi:unnamed protein product [Mytilus coruscus]|uniref:Uncharacterized protein n=1 Tax=Mytilus coruscus TaxID=42192 RepID=A0A6J8CRX5_MYTCO|nr:unnamed protein product [Mytilus coruscus]